MDATRFDQISRLFADRRLSRRQALVQGGAGLAVGALASAGLGAAGAAAQEASPEASPTVTSGEKTMYLFVQSFQSGSIAPKAGEDGTYTLTLEQGLGQTIYFADRPSRDVGATPTQEFLDGLGFWPENPPNAALVLETAPGETDTAVVELLNPVYDAAAANLTYDVQVLENWENSLELSFHEAPTDLADLASTFGTAHLFIDDCSSYTVTCCAGGDCKQTFPGTDYCWHGGFSFELYPAACTPCEPFYHESVRFEDIQSYWDQKCRDAEGSTYSAHNLAWWQG